jgi:hypothetical protein
MSEAVNNWKQSGSVYLWRYKSDRVKHAGWHFTADDDACECLIDLLDAMAAVSDATHRSLKLSPATEAVWGVPNFGLPRREALGTLTLRFLPTYEDLDIGYQDDRLTLQVGLARVQKLRAAILDVRLGGGDYHLSPNIRNDASRLWFWWMPWSVRR